MPSAPTSPSAAERLSSAACYLGLSPVVRLWKSQSSPFFRQHQTQAMAAFFILLTLLVALLLHDLIELFLLTHHPDFGRQLVNFEKPVWTCVGWLLLALPALWLLFIALCLAGSSRELPLLTRLARRPWIVRLTFALMIRADFDSVVRPKLSRQQLRRERVEQVFLNRAFERARTELRVVACNSMSKEKLDLRRVSAKLPP